MNCVLLKFTFEYLKKILEFSFASIMPVAPWSPSSWREKPIAQVWGLFS